MAFGEDFLQGFFGIENGGLRDYTHASKTFLSNGYEFAPRNKFLFHVYFNINVGGINSVRDTIPQDDVTGVGLLVKTIQLPSFTMDTETLNQYNRKRLVQKKINYLPVTIEFHDDSGDLVRNMWYNYFAYYYKDPAQQYGSTPNTNGSIGPSSTPSSFSYNARDIYQSNRAVNDWGFVGESYDQGNAGTAGSLGGENNAGKPPFFTDIVIYGLSQHKFAQYTLINPMIKEWRHDTYDYAQGNGTMTNTAIIEYETVKYYSGDVGRVKSDTNIKGFADPARYDTRKSPLARVGGTATVLGQGGLLDAGIGAIEDLQSGGLAGVIGAVQKAGTAYNTFKGKDIGKILKQDTITGVTQVLRNTTPGSVRQTIGGLDGFVFPTPRKGPGTATPPFNPN
jgi:hypothetical protein